MAFNRVSAHGQITLDGTAQRALTAATGIGQAAAAEGQGALVLKAHKGNAASCYWGLSAITTANGVELAPGESIVIEAENPWNIFVRGTAADKVGVAVLSR